MTDLIERLESAPDAEQGDLIAETIIFMQARGFISNVVAAEAHRLVSVGAYMDAAMTLIPEGWFVRLTEVRFGMWLTELWDGDKSTLIAPDIQLLGGTPALALTAAAMKAREA